MATYRFPIILLLFICFGGLLGSYLGTEAVVLKPLGDLFLNAMSTLVVPLVFFTIASSIANMGNLQRLGRLMAFMGFVFLFTGACAAALGLLAVKLFPLMDGMAFPSGISQTIKAQGISHHLVSVVSVPDFVHLLSRQHMLALIVFSILVGMSMVVVGEKAKPFAQLLNAGAEIWMTMVGLVMYYAPIGLGAYFAALVGEFGPALMDAYAKVVILYYPLSFFYLCIAFTLYAYLAAKQEGVRIFWRHALQPIATSLATCSSSASIPVNLDAAKQMGISKYIRETTITLGASLHKDGSVIGGIFKIAILANMFHLDFATPIALVTAFFVALLVGTVMGAVPGGGMVGEMLILSFYGFPPEALPVMAAISALIDPPATMLNSTGNIVTSMMVARLVEGKAFQKEETQVPGE